MKLHKIDSYKMKSSIYKQFGKNTNRINIKNDVMQILQNGIQKQNVYSHDDNDIVHKEIYQ